jgi:RimJ/RimL family protein N-acetyltransferase
MPDFSELELSTPRLRLRAPRVEDASALFAIYSDPAVTRFIAFGAWRAIDAAHEQIERERREMAAGDAVRLCIVRAADARVIGSCSLFRLHEQSRRAEVGYALASAAWGQGIARETVSALLRHGFETMGLRRIEADIDPRNAASARCLERLGFVREGLLRERWIVEGEVSDTAMYGLLARDWAAARRAA